MEHLRNSKKHVKGSPEESFVGNSHTCLEHEESISEPLIQKILLLKKR